MYLTEWEICTYSSRSSKEPPCISPSISGCYNQGRRDRGDRGGGGKELGAMPSPKNLAGIYEEHFLLKGLGLQLGPHGLSDLPTAL